MQRGTAVAGSFYPANADELRRTIGSLLAKAKVDRSIARGTVSFVAPHAGYQYSGSVAAYTYNLIASREAEKKTETFIVVGPNHTGMGEPIAVSMQDWRTPLGVVKNDVELSKQIVGSSHVISSDEDAHREEHSVEVQLPFLQSVADSPKCVFICMGDQSYDASMELVSAIEKAAARLRRSVTVIASSDMDHYESAKLAEAKDLPALKALETIDARLFNALIKKNNDSACGYGPMTVSALYAFDNGARKGTLLKYGNSGEATGDFKSVVAYASMAFTK